MPPEARRFESATSNSSTILSAEAQPTGILGGTFDPVHLGHLSAARQLLTLAGLDQVWLMPNNLPPHRPRAPLAPAADRLEMVRLATTGLKGISASAAEVERGGISYTIDTLRQLHSAEPGRPLCLLLGIDAALEIRAWHESEALLSEASFVIFSRPQVSLDPGRLKAIGFPPERTRVLQLETPAISGRMVRERLASGEPVDQLLTPAVAAFIRERGLYRPRARMG